MLEKNIKKLIKILEESSINEMEISTFWGKQRIRIKKDSKPSNDINLDILEHRIQNKTSNNINDNPDKQYEKNNKINITNNFSNENANIEDKVNTIKAPLVGTFYRSPKEGSPPFIKEGDFIKKGQVICIIEAMKIFNEIESEYSGQVKEILINDSTPIEYDQDLMTIVKE